MKRFAAVAVGLMLCARGLFAQSAERLLTPTRAGNIALGMSVDALYSTYGRENVKLVDLYSEGMFNPAVQVFLPSEPGVPLAIGRIDKICGEFRITGISTVSPLLRTADGLGVGSTVGEVRKRYPAARLNREEGASLIVEKLQMTFAPADGSFADSTRIVSVWSWAQLPDSITKCPR